MSSEWEMDAEIHFGNKRPKRVVEKKGEKIANHANTVAFHFSSHMIPAEAIGPDKNAIPVQGGLFLFLKGKKVIIPEINSIDFDG